MMAAMMMDDYVERHFLTRRQFECALGGAGDAGQLIAAGAIPGPVYGQLPDGSWWSSLSTTGVARTDRIARSRDLYYAPAALWWARRTILASRAQGLSIGQSAHHVRDFFIDGFVDELARHSLALKAFPRCFPATRFDRDAGRQQAEEEWTHWIEGRYAVCLRRFSAAACIRKESLAACLRELPLSTGSAEDLMERFAMVEDLEALLLPFAPFERSASTMGQVVDAHLERWSLAPRSGDSPSY